MSGNRLTKDLLTVEIDPGTPGTPPTPGQPGYPGFPAWDERRTYTSFTVGNPPYLPNPRYVPGRPESEIINGHLNLQFIPNWTNPVNHTEIIHHPAIPAVPPTPGSPGTPGSLPTYQHNYQFGWNGGATAVGSIAEDGVYRFFINPSNVGIFTGIGPLATNHDYRNIRWALRFDGDQYYVYENGVAVVALPAYFILTDEFAIRTLGGEVAFYINDTLIYRSALRSAGPSHVSAVMYSAGDQIINASIEQTVPAAIADTIGSLDLDETEPAILLYDGAGVLILAEDEPTIDLHDDSELVVMELVESEPVIRLMGPDFKGIVLLEDEPTISLEGGFIIPDYGVMQMMEDAPTIQLYGGMNNEVAVAEPLPKFLAYSGVGILQLVEPEPTIVLLDENGFNIITASIPPITVEMNIDVLPTYYAENVIRAEIPPITVRMYGGARIIASIPPITVSAVVRVTTGATITADIPAITVAMDVKAGAVAEIVASVPPITVKAYGGARIRADVPPITVAMEATGGRVATIAASVPPITVAMLCKVGTAITISANIPTIGYGGYGATISASIPPITVYVDASAASAPVLGYAYTMTLDNPQKPVTRYTGFAFRDIIRFEGKHYAFGASGAFELTGNTDDGIAISWAFKMGETGKVAGSADADMFNKRTLCVYFLGSYSGPTALTVKVDRGDERAYEQDPPPDAELRTLRFDPAQGLLGNLWTFGQYGAGPATIMQMQVLNRLQQRKKRYA